MHYAAKHHLPLKAIVDCLLEGASQREIARRYGLSPMTVHNAVIRLGRQAIAAQSVLLSHLNPRCRLVFDGLRSFVTSQDYPCDLTTLVDAEGETILAITHAVFRRAGRMTRLQRKRVRAKQAHWQIPHGTMSGSISTIWNELWPYLSIGDPKNPAIIDTDQHLAYRRIVQRSPVYRHLRRGNCADHRTTSSEAPRTAQNPLFPVNYVDRLIRHRLREHTRETIAFGRHSAMQLYRMWIFAWDLNTRREWRVKDPQAGRHAEQGSLTTEGVAAMARIKREFFRRRVDVRGGVLPGSLEAAWRAEVVTPPIRWKTGQAGTTVRVPRYTLRDLERVA
jgi:transposase-like protein